MPLVLLTAASPGTSYWGVVPGGLFDWSENIDGDLYPNTDGTQDLGLVENRIQRFHGNQISLTTTGTANIEPLAQEASIGLHHAAESVLAGLQAVDGSIISMNSDSAITSFAKYGSIAHGYIKNSHTSVYPNAGTSYAEYGGFVGGVIVNSIGGIVYGYNTSRLGGIAHGYVKNNGMIFAEASLTFGWVEYGNNEAAFGALSGGHVSNGYNDAATRGTLAFGHTYGYQMRASVFGSVAMGNAMSGNIRADGLGAMAFGSTTDAANSRAFAQGAVQINSGTNSVAFSFKVGDDGYGIRLIGTGTGTLRTGDIWCDGTDVFIRSNGVTKNLSDIP